MRQNANRYFGLSAPREFIWAQRAIILRAGVTGEYFAPPAISLSQQILCLHMCMRDLASRYIGNLDIFVLATEQFCAVFKTSS